MSTALSSPEILVAVLTPERKSITSTGTSRIIGCSTCASFQKGSTPESITLRFGDSGRKCAACGTSCGKPALLDLFSGAGGAARGYQQAGFCVLGVDINPQPHYIGCGFHQADALTFPLDGFDVIHASPPCQDYSVGTGFGHKAQVPRLIAPTRERLLLTRVPWVIENVVGARMHLRESVELCGSMFGLGLVRHRRFEMPWYSAWPPPHVCWSNDLDRDAVSVTAHGPPPRWYRKNPGKKWSIQVWRDAMGIDWMTRDELREAIPPAYTEWIGRQLLAAIESVA
jgi:hypothetical protein